MKATQSDASLGKEVCLNINVPVHYDKKNKKSNKKLLTKHIIIDIIIFASRLIAVIFWNLIWRNTQVG